MDGKPDGDDYLCTLIDKATDEVVNKATAPLVEALGYVKSDLTQRAKMANGCACAARQGRTDVVAVGGGCWNKINLALANHRAKYGESK